MDLVCIYIYIYMWSIYTKQLWWWFEHHTYVELIRFDLTNIAGDTMRHN